MSKKKITSKQNSFSKFLIIVILICLVLAGYFFLKQNNKLTKNTPAKIACTALQVVKPTNGQKVISPLEIEAIVDNTNPKCHWTVFEAQAGTMTLKDNSGQEIGTGILKTTSDWMTDQPVTYTGKIDFNATPASNDLILTIFEENPSGQRNSKQATVLLKY